MEGQTASNAVTGSSLRLARLVGAVLSGATGILYVLVGAGLTDIGSDKDARARILLAAAVVFFLLAAGLAVLPRRYVYVLGIIAQVVCIAGYFLIAPSRTPAYDGWGIAIKVLQVLLLGVLVYLVALRTPRAQARAALAGK